jgi:hypothetical protein
VRTKKRPMIQLYGLAFLLGAIATACAEDAKPAFPVMAPIEQYLGTSASAEIELARTAAPPSVSGDASVLVLGNHGYETAEKGKNGFVCLVWRSWAGPGGFDDPDFWSPKFRVPICYNPAGVRTLLPPYVERTKWALAGASKAEMKDRTRAALALHQITMPEPGAMAFMQSREGINADGQPMHHPHVMIYFAHTDSADWGANLPGSPIIAEQADPESITTFDVYVPSWSDETSHTHKAMEEMPLPPGGSAKWIER